MTVSRLIVGFVLVLMVAPLVRAAEAEMVENPAYKVWSRFGVGSTQTSTGEMQAGQMKMTMESTRALAEKADDHVTLDISGSVDVMGQKHDEPARKVNIPAKAEKKDVEDLGTEDVTAAGKTFKVHLDGQNLLPYLKGEVHKSPRKGFIYFDDDGNLVALRAGNFKAVFLEQRCPGTLQVWAEPFTVLRIPKLYNLRTDPFERADITSNTYWDWYMDHVYLLVPMQGFVGQFLETFKEYPPRQKAASFTIDQVMEHLTSAAHGGG